MASDQVDLVREVPDAHGTGGIQALLRYTDPDIEWRTAGTRPRRRAAPVHPQLQRQGPAPEAIGVTQVAGHHGD